MSELERRVHLSYPSVTERVRQVDYEKLGLPIQCIIEATVKMVTINLFKIISKNFLV